MPNFKASLARMNGKIKSFFSFLGNKLKNFKRLTVNEQVSYSCVGLGFLMMLTSVVLFIL